jgi:hypothetical protein
LEGIRFSTLELLSVERHLAEPSAAQRLIHEYPAFSGNSRSFFCRTNLSLIIQSEFNLSTAFTVRQVTYTALSGHPISTFGIDPLQVHPRDRASGSDRAKSTRVVELLIVECQTSSQIDQCKQRIKRKW